MHIPWAVRRAGSVTHGPHASHSRRLRSSLAAVRTRWLLAAALVVVMVVVVGCGSGSTQLPATVAGPAAGFERTLLMLAKGDGDPNPTAMQMVRTNFGAATKLTTPGDVQTNAASPGLAVVVLLAYGRFTWGGSVPPGAKPAPGAEVWGIADAKTGGLIGDGMNRVRSLDLSVLGTPTPVTPAKQREGREPAACVDRSAVSQCSIIYLMYSDLKPRGPSTARLRARPEDRRGPRDCPGRGFAGRRA